MFLPHVVVQRARIGHASLRQQDVRQVEGEPALAVARALAPPRLWGYLVDRALDGFCDGFARAHDGKVSTRIHQGLRVAQGVLRARVDALIDRRGADVALFALALDGERMHVLAGGALDAYALRGGELRRLTPDDLPEAGIVQAEPLWRTEPLSGGELVFAASRSLCQEAALERVCAASRAQPLLTPRALSELLAPNRVENAHGSVVVSFRVAG